MRRVTWFVTGAAAGVTGAMYTRRKVVAVVESVRPANLAGSAGSAAKRAGHRLTEAVREGVTAGRRREHELRAQRDGRLVRLSDYLDDGDEIVVDGEPIDSGRVIVMRHRER